MKIILDAMGGDYAPEAAVLGAVDAAKAYGTQINYPEKEPFVAATQVVYDQFVGNEAGKVSPELLEKVYEIIG